MLFRKKTEVEIELTDEELELKEKIEWLKKRYESLVSDRNQKKVDDARYLKEEQIISDEISELEREQNLKTFDDMMGNPIQMIDDWFNIEVHKKIKEVDDGRSAEQA